jgi:hypothetical protein
LLSRIINFSKYKGAFTYISVFLAVGISLFISLGSRSLGGSVNPDDISNILDLFRNWNSIFISIFPFLIPASKALSTSNILFKILWVLLFIIINSLFVGLFAIICQKPYYKTLRESDNNGGSKKKISKECAYYLYSAIVGDSGRFQYSDTNPRTFNVVSKLFETKFNFQEIYDKMYLKSIEDIKIINYLYSIVKITDKGVAYYMVDDEKLKELGIEREQVKAYVNLFAGFEEIYIWVQFSEDVNATELKWRVSIRSRGVKINDVASRHNGGGHDNASGARCENEEEMLQLIKELDELL